MKLDKEENPGHGFVNHKLVVNTPLLNPHKNNDVIAVLTNQISSLYLPC